MLRKRWFVYAVSCLVAALLVFLDQLLKLWAISNLQGQPSRRFIPGVLRLTYLENTGAAFGVFSNFGGVLTVVKIILILAMLAYFIYLPVETKLIKLRVPLILIIAGGIGNLLDRLRLGHVVDMLEFAFMRFPVFNLADVFVTVGIFLFAFLVLFVVKDAPLFETSKKNGK